jgi:hypothetical protein
MRPSRLAPTRSGRVDALSACSCRGPSSPGCRATLVSSGARGGRGTIVRAACTRRRPRRRRCRAPTRSAPAPTPEAGAAEGSRRHDGWRRRPSPRLAPSGGARASAVPQGAGRDSWRRSRSTPSRTATGRAATVRLLPAIRGLASMPVLDGASDPLLPLPSSVPAVPAHPRTTAGLLQLAAFRHSACPAGIGNLIPPDRTRKPMELNH